MLRLRRDRSTGALGDRVSERRSHPSEKDRAILVGYSDSGTSGTIKNDVQLPSLNLIM